ncbi:galactose mutarotase [Litoribacter alkaliphilus]|uniref:Aldose 1-epimerase n=1 Tax=Litoribacter ruber TaxID=702568 RepID=A0AAP2CJ70_9BACT|nr:aldose epimerase family protein [Litoribacter alkaliphilus]MBS9525733.1 galactose mutarotase [Litoribacter alkaliphilus]
MRSSKRMIALVCAGAMSTWLSCTADKQQDEDTFNTQINGKEVNLYHLRNNHGMEMSVTNYGGRVVKLVVPNKDGQLEDVVLGFDSVQEYRESSEAYFGAAIGRYGNRIANGRFTLDGEEYELARNNGPNALHGGPGGFHNVVWEVVEFDDQRIVLQYISADWEEGYPGRLEVQMSYHLTDDNEFRIDYKANTDRKTVVNLTHHSFFNLNGAGKADVRDHVLQLNASAFTPVDSVLIPYGEIRAVAGTPFDFTKATAIGGRIDQDHEQLQFGGGYDHNFVLDKEEVGAMTLAATVFAPQTGIKMEVFTTEPGIQFYSGNFLDGSVSGKDGRTYGYRGAFCLETQHFPDSPNQPNFPSTELESGDTYTQTSIYKFSVQK